MARVDFIDILYSKNKSALEFNFDTLFANPILCYLTQQDISALYYIATSLKYSGDINLKYREIDKIMTSRGFKKFAAGTNRVVYSFLEDQSFVMKVAVDKVGLKDNPAEYYNQHLLKPFVTKAFDVSPCGTVGLFERVMPISRIQEFESVADDIFDIITQKIIGKYVVDDIGTKYFMNWGIRRNVSPVLLDYPYVFELDGNKLYCNKHDMTTGVYCGGVIDYDAGFNTLVCTKCGKEYKAKELEANKKENLIILEGDYVMKVKLIRPDGTVICNPGTSSDYIQKPTTKKNEVKKNEGFKVSISNRTCCCNDSEDVEKETCTCNDDHECTCGDKDCTTERELEVVHATKIELGNKTEETKSKFIQKEEDNDKWNDIMEEYDDEAPRMQKLKKGGKSRKFDASEMKDF